MPTTTYVRNWCANCQEWELFRPGQEGKYTCLKCDSAQPEGLTLGDIPEEKISEQQKRFKEQRRRQVVGIFNYMGFLDSFSSTPGVITNENIVEHDAGLELLERREREANERARTERKNRVKMYADLGRNENCLCGSGKKFKKCCYDSIQQDSIKY